jgi:hypothetical protein
MKIIKISPKKKNLQIFLQVHLLTNVDYARISLYRLSEKRFAISKNTPLTNSTASHRNIIPYAVIRVLSGIPLSIFCSAGLGKILNNVNRKRKSATKI